MNPPGDDMKVVQITEKDFASKRSKLSELLRPDELSAFPHVFGLRGTSAELALSIASRGTDIQRRRSIRPKSAGSRGYYFYLSSCSAFQTGTELETGQKYGALVKSSHAAFLYGETTFCYFRRRTRQGLGVLLLGLGKDDMPMLNFDEEYAEDRRYASPYLGPFSMYLPRGLIVTSGLSFMGAIVTSPGINEKLMIDSPGFGSQERFIDYSNLGIGEETMQSAFLTKLIGLMRGRETDSLVDESDMKSIWARMNEIEYEHSQRVLAKTREGGLPVL